MRMFTVTARSEGEALMKAPIGFKYAERIWGEHDPRDELKPCPFCGESDKLLNYSCHAHIYFSCHNCGADTHFRDLENGGTITSSTVALDAWNRRGRDEEPQAGNRGWICFETSKDRDIWLGQE